MHCVPSILKTKCGEWACTNKHVFGGSSVDIPVIYGVFDMKQNVIHEK